MARADNETGLIAFGYKHYPRVDPTEKSTGSPKNDNIKISSQDSYTMSSFTTFTYENNKGNPNFEVIGSGDVKIPGDKCRSGSK